MTLRAGGARLFGGLLLFALLAASTAPLGWDLPEPRSRAGKIRVHPRGNLWATGHFMMGFLGKKSPTYKTLQRSSRYPYKMIVTWCGVRLGWGREARRRGQMASPQSRAGAQCHHGH